MKFHKHLWILLVLCALLASFVAAKSGFRLGSSSIPISTIKSRRRSSTTSITSSRNHAVGSSSVNIGWHTPKKSATRKPQSQGTSTPHDSTSSSIGWHVPKRQSTTTTTKAPHRSNFTIGWQHPNSETTRKPQNIRNSTTATVGSNIFGLGRNTTTTTTTQRSYTLWQTPKNTTTKIGWDSALMNATTPRPHRKPELPNNNTTNANLANYFRNHSLPVIPTLSHLPTNNHGLPALPPLHNQPGGTFIPPGSALPENVIYYPQPPVVSGNHQQESDWHIHLHLTPRPERHRHHHSNDKTTTTTTTPGPGMDIGPIRQAALQHGVSDPLTNTSTAPPAPPANGWVCVPIRVDEPSPVDTTKMIEVERVACYPAPPLNPFRPSIPIQVPAGSVALAPLYPMETPVLMKLAGAYQAPKQWG